MIRPLLFIAVLSAFVIPACKPVPAVVSASGQLKEGNLKEALKMAQEGLKKHPTDNELWKLLIHVHLAMGNVTEAVAAYRLNEKSLGHNRRMSAYLGLTVLRWALTHRDPEVRQEGIQGIRSSDAAPLLKDMLQRLNDPNEVVRTWAAVALSRMPQGADILDEQLRSTSARARALALEWVARIAGEKALKAVGAAAADRAAGVREAAARALTRTGAGGLEPLLKLLKDKERTVRAAAAEALGRQDQQRARKALAAALDDSYVGVRLAAARSLGTLKDSASKPALFKLASGDDLITALAAAKALFKLGEVQPVLDAIARSLEVGKVPARVAACNAAVVVNDRVAGQLAAGDHQ